MKNTIKYSLTIALSFLVLFGSKQLLSEESLNKSSTYNALKFRSIGPAVASGRIADIAVNPDNYNEFFVAVASGGVWKTTNHGVNFNPVFDNEGSYSIGCVSYDPSNTNIIWVGSGENNSQRSVSYGDGVYKSIDGGKSWKNMGLENSQHIGDIFVDPRNSDVVFVASQGPLWNSGGDRGLYKTTDGGKTWELSLEISENTGVSDIAANPNNPDEIYVSAYQRRRRVWTLINGGPESAIYKTVDGGKNWEKLSNGLPSGDVGRIGLDVSPVDTDIVYAIIEAKPSSQGFYRSTDRGASWTKMSSHVASSPQYYQEIFCDPVDKNKVYSLSTYTSVTSDGGRNFNTLGLDGRHVDDHALWIDPTNNSHLLIGGDGGLYESFDEGKSWEFFANIPVTQFYRVTVDNDKPFYNIYGGTQDNNTLGGPVRTTSAYGIANKDWYFTVGGDGFKTVVDPENPDIIYSQPQYGFLVRYDRKSGEMTGIQPQPEKDEILVWNWNSPVIISPHDNKTLYFAANKLFKSTDRGNSWSKISEDMTRKINRNELKIMGKVWKPDAISKNKSTSIYGNIVSLDESPLKKGLLYIGTDDGLIHFSENDGDTWTKYSSFTSVPETTYVSDVVASLHEVNTVYATFDNRKNGDFKPYVLKSNNNGNSWKNISGNLPDNLPVHSIIQDHEDSDLLFIGTEFGVYFTKDEGKNWIKLSSGLPTICVKEIDIQRRENDLALGTFGRGFYILDDYSPIREINKEILDKEAHIFNIKDALMYIEDRSRDRDSQGSDYYRADNPKFGAVFTYYINKDFEGNKDKEESEENYKYPSFEELEKKDRKKSPSLIFEIKDANGNLVRRIEKNYSKGIHRINWDLRYPDTSPVSERTKSESNSGFPVLPGEYTVEIKSLYNGKIENLAGPKEFTCKLLNNTTLPASSKEDLLSFHKSAFDVRKAIEGANKYIGRVKEHKSLLYNTIINDTKTELAIVTELDRIDDILYDAQEILNGNKARKSRYAAYSPGINERLSNVLYGFWYSTSAPTQTNIESINTIKSEYKELYDYLKRIDDILDRVNKKLENSESPWVPGRLPKLK